MNFFSRIWHSETHGLTTAALIVGAASLASRLVGVLRDRVLASSFGAGNTLDVYYAAFRVPDFLYNLLILGALSAGFIPIFSEYLETRQKHEAWRLAEQVLSVVGATMAVGCALLALLAPIIVPLTVPGFPPEKIELTIRLSRIMFLSPFFLGLSAVMGGILQAMRRFVAFSLAPVVYNLGIIFGALVLVPRMGIEGVAWGVVLGAFLHFVIQASVALRLGLRRIPPPSLSEPGVMRILKLMAPRTAGLAVSQLNLVILLMFASALSAGSVAVFNLANNLQSFPVGIIGISYAVAAFPLLSQAASHKDRTAFIRTLMSAIKKIAFFILPITGLFFLLRAQIVRLALGAGIFDWDDTIRTASVLGIFLVSLLGQSLAAILARAFYALQNTWTPLWIGIFSELTNVACAFLLRGSLGIMGLAFAFSLATYVNVVLLLWQLRRRYGPLSGERVFLSCAISGIASLALVGLGYVARQSIGTIFPLRTFWQVFFQAAGTTGAGVIGFYVTAYMLRSPELDEVVGAIRRKVGGVQPIISGAEEAQGR